MTPEVLNRTHVASWLERYRRAWIDRNAADAGALFTADAIYREHPFRTPFVGREAIQQYWATVTATQTDIDMRYGPAIVSDRRVPVEWWVNLRNGAGPIRAAAQRHVARRRRAGIWPAG